MDGSTLSRKGYGHGQSTDALRAFWKRHSRYLRDVQPAGGNLSSTITTPFRPRTSPVIRSRPPITFSAGWSRYSSFQTIDSGSTTFTLLVPTVNLPPSKVAN